ncbi:MAG: hydroxyphenylacetyl-CoA thioesterase PaaI [Burkholderiales bacterium]|nr:hydroxyphenylacetyl-CoA thioesterase PaaI [Burkholderiales bacterium]HNQ56012.1 hydroxyphenylacetyl-CoA thioesterase PaaI [Candidatus Desulfobacillus denitrificans]HNT61668.1 hydroxyphenylacetyl-CoA thioesterase PaaI [Candidatus Desulfobacillus denitrificans]
MMTTPTPQQIAERCADTLWPGDRAAQGMGMQLVEIGPGTARLRMAVREDMVNCHGICHGGYIFAVADTAFAYACNSYNHRTVAAGVDINFLAPVQLGDILTARGQVRQQGGRTGYYDIEVSNQDGKLVALFRGRASRIKGPIFEDENDDS